MQAQEMLPL